MASHVEGNAPTCGICSTILVGKCFVLDCDHILCDRCTNKGSSYYGCTKHNKVAKMISLAFCHPESKMIIRMAESVEFALNGQCNCKGCSKNALAAVKHCNHKLCFDCLLRKFGDGNRRKMDCITCPVIQCKNQFPLVFADGILGGCQMHRQKTRNHETVKFYENDSCDIPRDSGRPCNKKGCFYSSLCGYDVCCGCMMTYVTNNHRPEYVNKSLTDVVPCANKNCTHILLVKQILQLLDETEQKWTRTETVLCFANDKTYSCKTIGCKNTVTIFLKCGHYYCSRCFLRTTVNYIPLDGEFIPCRMCPYVTCSVWIRESNLNSISIGVDDFLRESSRLCYSSQHGWAVVETRCCSANLCLKCLTDVMQKSCVLSSFFGKEYDDVIMCNGSCICGVPKRFFFQFGKERSYPLFVEKQSNEQTDSCNRRAEKWELNKHNLKMSKIAPTENVEKMGTSETQSSNASNINTKKYNYEMARKKKSNGGRSTNELKYSKSNTAKTSTKTQTESAEKMETAETHSSDALNGAKRGKNRWMHKELTLNVYLRCEFPLQNGQLCNNQGCLYVHECGYAVCYSCMMQYIYNAHTPAYVKTSLADVVYCLKPDCTKIINIYTVKQILSKVVHEESKNEMQVHAAQSRTSFCWNPYCRKNAAVFLACGHTFCSTCFLFTKVKYIPGEQDGGYIRCRVCSFCDKWIREENLSSITLDEDDFLSTTPCKCNTIEHGSAVISTRCCKLNLCLGCLNDLQNKAVVSTLILGNKYDDVIKCMEGCQLGVPKRLLLQFIKKHYYQDVMGNHSQIGFAKTHKIIKKEAYQLKEIRSNEHVNDVTTQSLDVGSKHGKESGIFDSSLLKQSNSSHAFSEHNRLIGEDTSYKSTSGDDGSEEQMETDDNGSGSPLNIATPSANIAKYSCSSSSTIASSFEGIYNLKPVKDKSSCIDCGREAFAKLACNHPYCWVCLFDLNVLCNGKRCLERVPRKELTDLLDNLQHNAIKESEADSNMDTTGTAQTSMLAAETINNESGGNIKGVRNLGVMCYANSIFQVLGQTNNFKERLKNSLIEAINKDQKLPLTDNLAAILEQLNGNGGSATVETEVDNFLKKVVSLEGRYLMNDCCEFLMCVLEGLKAEDETTTLMFENTIQTSFKFKPCGHKEIGNPQISHSLLIPLSKGGNKSYSVSAGLKELLKTETFGEGVLPCRICHITTETKQGLALSKLPEILIIQIERVEATKKTFSWRYAKYAQKNDEFVRYDEDLDVPQTSEVNGNVKEIILNFRLFGVVLHTGSIDSGPYYSYVKKLHTDTWFSCNDSSVRPIEKKYVFENPNAYLLFYEKKHGARQNVIIHKQPSEICWQM